MNNDRTTPVNPPTSGDTADNPPGSTAEQLPADVLALLAHRTYLSTACETARLLDGAIIRNPERADLLGHRDRMHQRCRLNNESTGRPCSLPLPSRRQAGPPQRSRRTCRTPLRSRLQSTTTRGGTT